VGAGAALRAPRGAEPAAAGGAGQRQEAYAAVGSVPVALPAHRFLVERGRREIAAASLAAAIAERQMAAAASASAQVDWSRSAQRVSALERLEDRAREEYQVEVRRDEDAAVDDLVVFRTRRPR
jgi:hypothetical protein